MRSLRHWTFQAAEKILEKIDGKIPQKGYVLFETGYGPSGLPHIGTFGEVARVTMVQKAFEMISGGIKTKLICFSDDMDGMRKIPDTIKERAHEYLQYIGKPLTAIPDPFDKHESFANNMNARLRAFLDEFGFEYEFKSATECYKNGTFNSMLIKVMEKYDEIMNVMLPTLRDERQKTYSPFLPICQKTGRVLNVSIIDMDIEKGTISYMDEDGERCETSVFNGGCKLQWKPDFGMRWAAFDVDFEIYGKDHLVNGKIYSQICSILGGKPPYQIFFELFLDEEGKKISKSKGNGMTIDEWLDCAPQETLRFFIHATPQKAKKLHIGIIPKCVDEYITLLNQYNDEQDQRIKMESPLFSAHCGNVPNFKIDVTYSLLLHLAFACGSETVEVIWKYILKMPNAPKRGEIAFFDKMVSGAVNYFLKYEKPRRILREPTNAELVAFRLLINKLSIQSEQSPQELQNLVYSVAQECNMDVKEWFCAIYETLFGSVNGPRFGSFIALYGIQETIKLIKNRCFKE
ncbi:Lysine--tRNA ligase [Candidatus Cyrtobacter comes]|uniref:Lysine--tRNA ligase n=1 Tax=Candidatus Cyrtobacter comes TaxID=675776 RepID=A0ABU5L7S6_9RICK|nr:lysine--tRNA ligase [Candidatus Cyrtobacter comes]MDZ5762181.1 Lysine--tRNA ligase [Candidatus Cyrtobacter comes]